MIIRSAPQLVQVLRKQNVRLRKSFKEAIILFSKDPYNPQLNNHMLKREWAGYRSINVTVDYRAIYREIKEESGITAYFVAIGTHRKLYSSN